MADRVVVRLHPHQGALRFQCQLDGAPRLETILAGEGAPGRVDHTRQVENLDGLQSGTPGDFEVDGVVGGGHLHSTGAEFRVHGLVGDDWYLSPQEGQPDRPANQMSIPVVVGMDCHAGVPKHRLCPGGRYLYATLAVGKGIADPHQLALHLGMLDFDLAERRVATWAPVDDPIAG